jgi:hypothetical protein
MRKIMIGVVVVAGEYDRTDPTSPGAGAARRA